MKKVLLLIPAYNSELSIKSILDKILSLKNKLDSNSFEVLVVNDGSNDNTKSILKQYEVNTIENKKNLGLGISLYKGYTYFLNNKYDYLITLDSDGQHDPLSIPEIIFELNNGADIVFASRYSKNSMKINVPDDRELLNFVTKIVVNQLTNYNISDPLTGFKGYTKEIVTCLLNEKLIAKRYCSCIEEILKLYHFYGEKINIQEIPHPAIYKIRNNTHLNSKYRIGKSKERLSRLVDVADIILQTSHLYNINNCLIDGNLFKLKD